MEFKRNAINHFYKNKKETSLRIIKDKNNESNGKQIFKPQTSSLMNKILRLTATNGSAKRANVDQYLVGAKTGTAEKIINGKYSKKLNIDEICTNCT